MPKCDEKIPVYAPPVGPHGRGSIHLPDGKSTGADGTKEESAGTSEGDGIVRSVGAALALIAALVTSGCDPRPPPMPYATVGVYDGRCGYDYNGKAVKIGELNRAARNWDRGTEAVLLFRFEPEPVPRACFEKARAALQAAGFAHVWVIVTPRPGPHDRPVMP